MTDPILTEQGVRCAALCDEPPHFIHTHPCRNPGKERVGEDGVPVCGTHLRVAERWELWGSLESLLDTWRR